MSARYADDGRAAATRRRLDFDDDKVGGGVRYISRQSRRALVARFLHCQMACRTGYSGDASIIYDRLPASFQEARRRYECLLILLPTRRDEVVLFMRR